MSNQKIRERWEQTQLLNKLPDALKNKMALAFQSQYDFCEGNEDISAKFMRVSIPLVRRTLPGLEFQVETIKKDILFSDVNMRNYILTDIEFNEETASMDGPHYNLDTEAEYVAEIAQELHDYIGDWNIEHGMLNFVAFGLVEGKIAIFVEKHNW